MNTRARALFFILIFIFGPAAYAEAASIQSVPIQSSAMGEPYWIYVPSIEVSSAIKGVGIDKKGNMDVPSGKTADVGWYKFGPVPGHTGTAVLDAHVTAAFKDLNKVKTGDSIYIYTTGGQVLRFVAKSSKEYEAKTTPSTVLFAPSKSPDLKLITCSGTLLGGGEATHRLIVSARLAA